MASLNGGVDACAGGGAGSPQCQKSLWGTWTIGSLERSVKADLILVLKFCLLFRVIQDLII